MRQDRASYASVLKGNSCKPGSTKSPGSCLWLEMKSEHVLDWAVPWQSPSVLQKPESKQLRQAQWREGLSSSYWRDAWFFSDLCKKTWLKMSLKQELRKRLHCISSLRWERVFKGTSAHCAKERDLNNLSSQMCYSHIGEYHHPNFPKTPEVKKAGGIDRPLSCWVNTGLRESEIYFCHF